MEGYDLDDMNAKGAFNYSSLQIVRASELVEPSGWYLGREYYVVAEGLVVGVFHDLSVFMALPSVWAAYTKRFRSEVLRSVKPSLSRLWLSSKVWQEAVRMWDIACRTPGAVRILRANLKNATTSATPPASTPCSNTAAPAAHWRVFDRPLSNSAPLPSSPLVSKPQPPSVVVISDSDSDGNDNSDSEVEATTPKPIRKKVDCFDLTDDENGSPILRKTYDAATDTYLDAPTKTRFPAKGVRCSSTATLKHHRSPHQLRQALVTDPRVHTSIHPSQSRA